MQQSTIDGRSKGGWWSRSRRLTGGNATTSQGKQELDVVAQREAKTEAQTEAKTDAQTATMTQRLLVATTTPTTQNNNQPTMGASKCG